MHILYFYNYDISFSMFLHSYVVKNIIIAFLHLSIYFS